VKERKAWMKMLLKILWISMMIFSFTF
jgi:hypothetical protein